MREYAVKHPEAVIYWESKDGIKREALILHFYQNPWMKNVVTDSLEQLNNPDLYQPKTGDLICFRTASDTLATKDFSLEPAYKWFPNWLLRYNPNNWQSRTQIWKVCRINKETSG